MEGGRGREEGVGEGGGGDHCLWIVDSSIMGQKRDRGEERNYGQVKNSIY